MRTKNILRAILIIILTGILIPSSSLCETISFDDPIKLGVGARPIGMGRAFTAIADDGNAIFVNPAGLGMLDRWYFTSMNTNFMDEFPYFTLSYVNPTEFGTFGLGYLTSSSGDVRVTGGGTTVFENRIILLSYGGYVGNYLYDWFGREEEEVYFGANFKYASKGFSGDADASGSGFNMDLGLKYIPIGNEWISYGFNLQNAFPSWLGTKVGGGIEEEDMPMLLKSGVAFNIYNERLKIALDSEMHLFRKVPSPFHIGAEWILSKLLTIRGGLDHSIGGEGGNMSSHPTMGIGLNLNGFTLDFAYRIDFAETGSSSNFISFSFQGEPEKEKEKRVKKRVKKEPEKEEKPKEKVIPSIERVTEKLFLSSPKDKEYTYANRVEVKGVVGMDVSRLIVSDRRIRISGDKKFDTYERLKIGKNTIKFRVIDNRGKEDKFERRILRLYMPQGIAASEIESKTLDYKISATLISEYIGREYRYNEKLSRAMLAVIISKAGKYKLPVLFRAVATDLQRDHWAAREAQSVINKGDMRLYKDGSFRPDVFITRGEFIRTISITTGFPADQLSNFLLSDELNGETTIGDVLSVMYNTNIFKVDVDDYLAFLNISPSEVRARVMPELPEKEVTSITIESPEDKYVTFNIYVKVKGRVVGKNVESVEVNGEVVGVKNNKFSKEVMLNMGKNRIVIDARLKDGGISTIKRRILKAALPFDAVFEERQKMEQKPSEYKAALIILADIAKRSFGLDEKLSREEFCKIIFDAKQMATPLIRENIAVDVPVGHRYAKEIKAVLDSKAIKPYPSGEFRPSGKITRSELLEAIAVLQRVDISAASEFFDEQKDLSQQATMEDLVQLLWRSGILKDRINKFLDWGSY